MKSISDRLTLCLACLLWFQASIAPPAAVGKSAPSTTQNSLIATNSIDLREFLGNPPADDSAEHQVELQTLLHWQEKRTPEDVARCESEVASTPFTFSEIIGPWFSADRLPVTASLFEKVGSEVRVPLTAAKLTWKRVRPFKADERIHPCVVVEVTNSYPSGHATRGIVWATLLGQIFPDQREALVAMGRRIGNDRVIAGMHYPSDVAAGQKLGAELARLMLASPEMADALTRAKAECAKVAAANAGK